jgi:hypothetical protein
MSPKHPPGPPMTLGNMRELGVHHLIGCYVNDACRELELCGGAIWVGLGSVRPAKRTHGLPIGRSRAMLLGMSDDPLKTLDWRHMDQERTHETRDHPG